MFDEGAFAPKSASKSLMAVVPHGILSLGFVFLATSTELDSSNVKWLVTDALIQLPFIRDFCAWIDAWEVNKTRMTEFMKKGENVALLPGGFQEATLYLRDRHRAYARNRKGFIKYALQYGYAVIPVYVFGEERLEYEQIVCQLLCEELIYISVEVDVDIGEHLDISYDGNHTKIPILVI